MATAVNTTEGTDPEEKRNSILCMLYFSCPAVHLGFPGGTSGKESNCQCRRHTRCGFNPWVMGIPDHLTCLLRNLYAGQEATARAGHGTTDWFQIGKEVRHIMRNAGLEEAQAGIKIAGRNINNLRYADDTTLMAESEEELKSFLIRVKEESEKVGLKLNIQKTKIMASGPIT